MEKRISALFVMMFSLLPSAWALPTRELLLTPQELPATCQIVTGIYPAGIRTSMLYDYKRYAGAMPPLTQKTAQSFSCSGIRGSLLYFEYATADQRDQAELFAKPILSREEGIPNPVEIHDWANGFVVVSFKVPPADLTAVLDRKLNGGTVASAAPAATFPPPVPVAVTPPVAAPPPVSAAPAPAFTHLTAPVVPPPVFRPTPPPPLEAKAVTDVSLDQMATPKPAAPLSAEPPMDAAHSLSGSRVPPAAPPPAPPPVVSPPPAPVVQVPTVRPVPPPPPPPRIQTAMAVPVVAPPTIVYAPPPVVVAPPVYVPPPVVAPPIPKPKPIPPPPPPPVVRPIPPPPPPSVIVVHSLTDVPDSVIASFAEKLDCANPDLKEQGKMVCRILDDFKNGTKPTLPQGSSEIILGPVYTVDDYGRLVDQHDDVITGSDYPGYASFFAVVSSNGQQDFEIQSLIDARKTQKPLPVNGSLRMIQLTAAKKRFPVVPTNGASVAILPGGPRRVYIRKTGDHWVIFGPQGATPDEQTRANVVLAELY